MEMVQVMEDIRREPLLEVMEVTLMGMVVAMADILTMEEMGPIKLIIK